ncbi:MAG: hypothetical protein AAFY59_10270 [Pseudomonadota bacterium]
MKRLAIVALTASLSAPAGAQEQQAGNAASIDTEGTFQALIEKCDDVDALMLRARIRLQLPRTTEEAAATAQQMLDDAFATCGGGDLEGAKAQLSEALAIAEAGATENFETDASVAETEAETTPAANAEPVEEEKRPWWKLW